MPPLTRLQRVLRLRWTLLAAIFMAPLLVLLAWSEAEAYAGPGAGFAIVTSFLVVIAAVGLAGMYLVAWPFRLLWRFVSGKRAFKYARTKRVVVLGLDGLDAGLCRRFLDEGKLPNLAGLHFLPLATTNPAISPVAWSTFQTGMDPSYHAIFDFLRPTRSSYSAEISSVIITRPWRSFRIGRYRVPLGRTRVRLRRQGVPFWKILGDHGIFSAILRVPVSFPPERFRGVSLSAMCVPDLRGTQGTFTLYTSHAECSGESEGGIRVPVTLEGNRVKAELVGPPNPFLESNPPLRLPFRVELGRDRDKAVLVIGRRKVHLDRGRHSDWVRIAFRPGFGVKIRGLVRFCLMETSPNFRLYVSPIHFDPERPVLPISQPRAYSVYLSKRFGPYATLGLAEDTWALNEGAVGGEEFLDGTYRIHQERESMFFDALDKVRRGLVVCVFDASDRIQHMFLRTLSSDETARGNEDRLENAVEAMYRRMDDLVGRTRSALRSGDVLLVISDHGFRPFKRGINLNAWLRQEGFLCLKENAHPGGWFAGVDWERTSAYALGLSGLYLNRRGRDSKGTVGREDARRLKATIRSRLEALKDPANPDARPVNVVFDTEEIYSGPYRDEAPDLLIGYGDGYRVSWEAATGHTDGEVFEDNEKAWGGDHCVDPSLVPGVLFSTLPLEGVKHAGLADIAPSVLDLFGVEPPPAMKGRALFGAEVS